MVVDGIVTKLAELGLGAVADYLRGKYPGKGTMLRVDASGVNTTLARHVEVVEKWAAELPYSELSSRELHNSYVDLDLNVSPYRVRGRADGDRTFKVSDLAARADNIVLLGDPGAGKTTSLKTIASEVLKPTDGPDRLPVLVQLRRLSARDSLVDELLAIIGLRFDFGELGPQRQKKEKQELLARFLNSGRAVVLLDGLDELLPSNLSDVVGEIGDLLLATDTSRILITCRSGAFVFGLPSVTILEISPLSGAQVKQFAQRWLGSARAKTFLRQIRAMPYAGSEIRPLTLSQLCAIFERAGRVPDRPKSVYKLVVRLYLQEWDMQRFVSRQSRYAGFEVDRKEEFLEALAYTLTRNAARGAFSHTELREAYITICADFGLPQRDASLVAREIESHTGLVVEAGRDAYEFAHKSIQEFLTAQYIVRLPRLPSRQILASMPSELAIAVVESSRPSIYFAGVVRAYLPRDGIQAENLSALEFTSAFLSRLVLERGEFATNTEFGVALLTLISHAYLNRPAQFADDQRTKFDDLVSAVLRLSGVRTSLDEVQKHARFRRDRDENCVVDMDLYFRLLAI